MMNSKCQQIYTSIFSVIIEHSDVFSLPLDVTTLCKRLGIQLCPLSEIISGTGLSKESLFQIWGNHDGVLTAYRGQSKIAYNDNQSILRTRFTICEEIAHFICGHLDNPQFRLFNQEYDAATYQEYEEAGRIGAGLLLCQPQFFYHHPNLLNPTDLAKLCKITPSCAKVRYDVFTRFKTSITSNPLFPLLPQPKISYPLFSQICCQPRQSRRGYALEWDSVIG